MSVLVSFNIADRQALDHVCKRTGLNQTAILRKLLWAYARGTIDVPDLLSMKTSKYNPPEAPAPGAT